MPERKKSPSRRKTGRKRAKPAETDATADAKGEETEEAKGEETEDRPLEDDADVAEILPAGSAKPEDSAGLDEALDLPVEEGDDDDEETPAAPVKPTARKRKKTGTRSKDTKVLEPGAVRNGRSLVLYDPLTAYIQEIRRYELLSREEERELAVRYREEGDVDAARDLVTANLRLVVKIAHEYRKAHQNLLDLIQEGNIGLMQAVRKFDPYRGVKLSTYSSWWIRAYILKFILNNWRLVKIGTTQAQRKLFFNLSKQREELRRKGVEPRAGSIATALDVPEREVVEMERRLAAPELSLSAPVGKSDSATPRTYLDTLHDGTTAPDEEVAAAEFRELLTKNLEAFARTLKGRDALIYRERLMTDEPLTLKEIGDRYGITKERARQLEKRLLGKLRDFLRQQMGDAVEVALGLET